MGNRPQQWDALLNGQSWSDERSAETALYRLRSLVETGHHLLDPTTKAYERALASSCIQIGVPVGLLFILRPEGDTLELMASQGVPEHILNKPGPLDTAERQWIQQHPVVGAEMLEEIPLLSDFAPVVRRHHERFGGRGYPDGLRGEEIPFHSRIIANEFTT